MKPLIYIIIASSTFMLSSCTSSKVIYNQKNSINENIKITYHFGGGCNFFYTSLYKEKRVMVDIVLKDCPRRFGIDKRNISDGKENYTYRMVTDTSGYQFKCIDYNFLPQYCNSTVARSFIPITEKEKEIFEVLQKTIQSGNYGVKIEINDINRFIGWVKIPY